MRVLIVGSGGREHALAWKALQSPRLAALYVAPGNAGTAAVAQNVPISAENTGELADFARRENIDLVIIGPEAPLAVGLADVLRDAGCGVFGPSRAAAQLEASKAFAKDFMQRHGIPTAQAQAFSDYYEAVGYLLGIDVEPDGVVIKASGLAAGKGVIIPECADDAEAALRQILLDGAFGPAGDVVVIEERLQGEEVSLLAFTDGYTVQPMPPAQDHKRLLDGDQGPNTGGMGAYAPAPVCPPELVEELTRTIMQPTIDGLRADGTPFVGVLYAGLMLTSTGPRVLEFNCRFGDPETQVVLPLLASDLLEIAEACADQRLDRVDVSWHEAAAACVVMAAEGYPGTYARGSEVKLPASLPAEAAIFHAGTRLSDDTIVTAGGRVLAVTAWGADLEVAMSRAYQVVETIDFEGCQYRRDIGWRARSQAS
jgi:phosphoribosylamine--glycine ligase